MEKSGYLSCHLPDAVDELKEDRWSVCICVVLISVAKSLGQENEKCRELCGISLFSFLLRNPTQEIELVPGTNGQTDRWPAGPAQLTVGEGSSGTCVSGVLFRTVSALPSETDPPQKTHASFCQEHTPLAVTVSGVTDLFSCGIISFITPQGGWKTTNARG